MEERLALIELIERDGSVRTRYSVTHWPVRIGRGFDCDVVLDDPHVAVRHAELEPDADGRLTISALTSVNGVELDSHRLAEGQSAVLPASGLLQLGQTRLRVRSAGEALAPERPLAIRVRTSRRVVLALAVIALLLTFAENWLDLDPSVKFSTTWTTVFVGPGIALLVWSLIWGLGSKLFQHHFQFLPHLRMVLVCVIAAAGIDAVLHAGAYMFGWNWASRIAGWAQVACLAALVRAHLIYVLPAFQRVITRAVGAAFIATMSVSMAMTWQRSDRVFDELYTATFGPPSLRFAATLTPQAFIEDARALKDTLDRHAREDADGEDDFAED